MTTHDIWVFFGGFIFALACVFGLLAVIFKIANSRD